MCSRCDPARVEGVGRPGRVERGLLPDPEGHNRRGHERAGASVPGAAPVQHQRAGGRVREVLLRPAHPRRGERPLLPQRAAEQGAGPEAGGDVQRHAGQVRHRGPQERPEEVVQSRQRGERGRGPAPQRRHTVVMTKWNSCEEGIRVSLRSRLES